MASMHFGWCTCHLIHPRGAKSHLHSSKPPSMAWILLELGLSVMVEMISPSRFLQVSTTRTCSRYTFPRFLNIFLQLINSSRAVACRISIYVLTILLSRDWTLWYQKLGNMGFIWYWAWWITSKIMGADHNMLSGQGNVISSWVMTTSSIQTLLSKNTTRTMSR